MLGKLQRRHQPGPLHLTDQWVVGKHFPQNALQVRPRVVLHLAHDTFVTQRLQVGDGHCRRHRVAGIGQAVGKYPAALHQRLGNALAQHQAAHGHIAAGQALGNRQGVGLEAEVFMGEPFAGAAKATDHLIGAQQHVVLAADTLDFRPVAFRREDHAAGPLEGFGNEAGNVLGTQFEDLFLQLQGAAAAELGRGQFTALGVPVRFVDVCHIRNQPAHVVHELHPAQRRGRQG
ncbi:hypothetical protein D3C79_787640 [compost metagenome]